MKTTFLIVLFCGIGLNIFAQDIQYSVIPSFTAYAMPSEENVRIGENGITNWVSSKTSIFFYFRLQKTGKLQLLLKTGKVVPHSTYKVLVADKVFDVMCTAKSLDTLNVGELEIKKSGYYSVQIIPVSTETSRFFDLQSLILKGEATENIHFNSESRRNSSSVHLSYPVASDKNVEWFYNEVTIPQGFDHLHSYYMACGFGKGYFGIQVNSEVERRVIFSIWDSSNEAIDRNKVQLDDKVRLIKKGKDVFSGDFGNEGTGGHSHLIWNWTTGKKYCFLVHALPETTFTTYTGYFKDPDKNEWMLISSWKSPKDGKYLNHLYSFIENFWGTNGNLERKARFANQWICTSAGEWIELSKASFSHDPTGNKMRLDYGASVKNNGFILWNGGFKEGTAQYGQSFVREVGGKQPDINFTKLP
jgi:hypothetical protein